MKMDINNVELEEMKQELSELKLKLDKETIINDRLMRKTMKTKVSAINRDALIIALVAILGVPYCSWVFRSMIDVSWWFVIVTDIFFLVAVVYTYLTYKDIRSKKLMEGDLLEVSRKMVRMNRMNADWLKFSIPFLAVWFTWLIFELVGSAQYGVEILIGGIVGLGIGLTFGIAQYRKTRRMANEIIEQIKDME